MKKIFILTLIMYIILIITLKAVDIILPNQEYYLLKPRTVRQNSKYIFIVDEKSGTVYKINKRKSDKISIIGKKGKGPGELIEPDYIFANDSLLYVNNKGNGKITIFNIKSNSYVSDYNIRSFFFVVNDDYIYSVPSYKSNFKYLVDVYDKKGNYIKSIINSNITVKSGNDFYKIIGSVAIDGDILCYTYMFKKFEIIVYNLRTNKQYILKYPSKLKIKNPNLKKTSDKSGLFIVNSDIKIQKGKIFILSVLDKYYAARFIAVFSLSTKKLIGRYKIREKVKSEKEFEKNIPAYIYFDLDKEYFYFSDLVYKNELVRVPKKELIYINQNN